jgi:hypothetical protein
LFGGRSRADLRVLLTGGHTRNSSGRGCVPSLHAATASGWRCSARDGRTGLTVTAGARPTSRHGPVRARNRRPSRFEGSAVLFRGCGVPVVQEWVAQHHRVDTSLTAQYSIAAGMAPPGGLAEQHRGVIPRRVRGVAWICL